MVNKIIQLQPSSKKDRQWIAGNIAGRNRSLSHHLETSITVKMVLFSS